MTGEPHKWSINITCPKCRHIGDVETSFPCCEHVADLEKQLAERDATIAEYEITRSIGKEWVATIAGLKAQLGGTERALASAMQQCGEDSATIAAMREALEAYPAYPFQPTDEHGSTAPFMDAVLLFERFRKDALSPSAGRDWEARIREDERKRSFADGIEYRAHLLEEGWNNAVEACVKMCHEADRHILAEEIRRKLKREVKPAVEPRQITGHHFEPGASENWTCIHCGGRCVLGEGRVVVDFTGPDECTGEVKP